MAISLGIYPTFSDKPIYRLPEDTLPDDDLSRARRGGDYCVGSHLNFVLEGCRIDEEKGQEGQDQQRRLWLALDGVTLADSLGTLNK